MNLTNEQKMEILRKYINPQVDFVKASNGEILLSVEASRRIAKEFNLKITENGQFKPNAICEHIVQREQQRLAAQESMRRVRESEDSRKKELNDKLNRVMECIKTAKESDEGDYAIAKALDTECSDIDLKTIYSGIDAAVSNGLIGANNIVKNNLRMIKNRKSVTARFKSVQSGVKNRDKLIENLANDALNYYTKGALSFGHITLALAYAELDQDIIDEVIERFYAAYEPIFLQFYGKVDMTEEVVQSIYNKYLQNDMFNAEVIVGYISKLNTPVNKDDIAYQLYRLEGEEKAVYQIMMIQGISVDERVQKLIDLGLQYPDACLERTFEILKQGYNLPYDEILKKYSEARGLEEEELEEEIEELQPVEANVASLTEDGEDFVEEDEDTDELVEEEEYTPRRLKIVKREKEVKKIERKKTLATLLMGAGFIPVAVLSLIFKTDPLVAANNCVSALSQLAEGGMGLKGILPSAAQLTALFAGMGTTFVGFVKYLKNRKRLKAAKKDLAELQEEELTEELDIEEETVKKGRR